MAAGQKKKRLNGSCVESVNLLERCHTKKKKNMDSMNNLLNMRAHVSVEWDDDQQMVVAKRDQIGIAWRELGPFIPLSPRSKDLADVFSVLQELFGLKDVTDVLSCEVWEMQLSEAERSLLTDFLPEGSDAKQVVQTLLTGENFHFGNPFHKWGASVCSGDFHPDAILSREQCLKEKKKAYYFELHKYHNNMLEILQNLKEIWESCEDPERDMVDKIRSFSRTCRNGSRPCEPEENLLATTESCSPVAEEKVRNRKQSTFTTKSGELQERNGLDRRRILTASDGTRLAKSSRKEEKPQKLCISGDGAKYMSYVMITKKQHELVKGMQISGSGIKSTFLSPVLGDIKSFKIQPYVALEEEERKKLHEHWLQLANRDIPSAFANWKERQLRRQQWRSSLEQELAGQKDAVVVEDEVKGNLINSPENRNEGKTYDEAPMDIQNCESDEDSAHSASSGSLQQSPSGSSLNCNQDLGSMDKELVVSSPEIYKRESAWPAPSKITEERKSADVAVEHKILIHSPKGPLLHLRNNLPLQQIPSLNHQHDDNAMGVTLTEVVEQKVLIDSPKGPLLHHRNNLHLQRIPSLNHQHEDNAMDVQLGESSQDILKLEPNDVLPILSDFVGTMSSMADAVHQEVPGPTAKDTWSDVGEPDPYYHSTSATHGYTSSSELSLRQPNIFGVRSNCWIDVETNLLNQDAKGTLLHRPSNAVGPGFNVDSGIAPFSSYTNQDRNEHLQPFLPVRGLLSSHANDQKQVGLQFLGASNGLQETELHPGHVQEHHLLMQRQQMRERELYMHQAAHKSMNYSGSGSGSGRYSLPSQEYFSLVNMQSWNVDADNLSAPLQVQPSGRESFSQNTFPMEHQACGVWSGMDISSSSGQCMGNGSNADGSLYSAFSQFHNLQPHSSYSSMGTQQQNVSPRNFASGGIANNVVVPPRNFVSGGIPSNGDVYQHTGHQHSYLGCEAIAPASERANNTSRTNLQHRSTGLHDSIGKQLLRSWNQ